MSHDQIRALEKRVEELEARLELSELMTPRQVCDFLQISERRFYELKEQNDAPPAMYWSARTVRYDRDAVMAWAKSKERGQA